MRRIAITIGVTFLIVIALAAGYFYFLVHNLG